MSRGEALEKVARARVANLEALDLLRAVAQWAAADDQLESVYDATDALVALLALTDYATKGIVNEISSAR